MKITMVEKRVGELLGPVDYAYNFRKHFESWGVCEGDKNVMTNKAIQMLRDFEAHPGEYQATTDGGWPRVGWGAVLAVGMYDGWPWWRPVPCVMIKGPLGGEWTTFSNITGFERFAKFRPRPIPQTLEELNEAINDSTLL